MNECSTSWSQQCSSIIKYFPVLLLLLLGIGMGTGEIYHSDQFGYTVMAPAVVASNQPYTVAMSIFNCSQLSIYHVRLRGPNTNLSIQFTLTPYFPTTLYAFKVPSLNLGTYWLEVTTEKGCYVKNSTTLESSNFDNFIKVHTPKVLYHPGQLLQFRVFFHDYNMLPVTPAANTVIWIEDAKGYHVKGFRQLTINNGIFEGELRLSAHVNFGRWRICGRSAPHVIEQCSYIHVAKYELSKMNMHLKAPSEVYLVNGSFEVTVNAVHVIDGPVNGEVTLDIALYTGNLTAEPVQQVKIKSQIVNGDGKIKIDLKQFEKNLSKLKEGILQLTANIFERVIQQDQKVTRMVTIRTYTPITSQIFSKPIEDRYYLKVGYNNSTELIENAIGMIVQNGRVLDSIKVNPYKRNWFELEVKIKPELWPVFHVILLSFFTYKPKLFQIYSSIVDLRLSHHDGVFIDLPTQLSPGIEIMFNVKSIPDSYIGLTILDDRVFAFGENMDNDFRADYYDFIKAPMMSNDIIQTDKHTIVQPGLILLSNAERFDPNKLVKRRIKQVEPFNSTTIKGSIFNKLTNLYKKPVTSYYKCCDVPTTYREYNDVWLYDSIHHTQTEWSSWHAVVPEALINWRISAFSVHPLTGLSFLAPKPFKYVLAASELYYSLQLPYSIHPEEKLEISLVVSSWFNAKLKVEIRLMESIRFQVVGENKTDLSHKEVIIAPNSTVSVKYYIQALMVGKCQLRFTIISEAGVYDVTREVYVLEDINLRSQQFFKHQILTLRQPIAKGSLKLHHLPTSSGVQCYVSGDLVVPKMQNIKLIESTDNAEQMISKLLSIYLLYDYIKDFTWCSPNFKKFLMEELSAGFQSMMRLRMYDGGYRLYAENEKTSCSSTWLTAYAVLLLHRLEKFPSIIYEDRLIKKSEKFVMHNRGRYREFKDSCYVPGRRNLSAVELNIEIIKTLEASKRLISLKQPHAYVTYAMDQKYNYYMEAKRGLKPVKWKLPEEKSSWIYYRRELETAGRILSRQVTLGNIEQQAEIFEWLTYNLLGPVSTIHCYECYIAEQAYYDYLKTRTNLESNIKLKIWMNSKITNYTVFINNTNEWQEQYMELQPLNSTIDFEAEGTGDLVIRCNYKYVGGHSNIKLYHGYLSFTNATQIKFCVQRFKRDRKEYMGTNIDIRLPSGYKLEDGSVALLMDKRLIIQASSVKRRSVLSLIMDPIPAAKLFCYSFNTIRLTTVTNLRNGTMSVYDFNNSDNPQIFSFNIFENTA